MLQTRWTPLAKLVKAPTSANVSNVTSTSAEIKVDDKAE
ncbi:hypothetical protein Nizo2802_1594 [Lactiplantibacillus plantarum]|nr:hypothetical protein Nizo2802_1594 [Lactiplantibacillus plantarum]